MNEWSVCVCEDGSGRGGRAAANKRGQAPGAVGLSFEKMQLVRQKKEEIEKVSGRCDLVSDVRLFNCWLEEKMRHNASSTYSFWI